MMVVDRLYLFVIYTQPSMWADLFFYRNSKVGWDSQSIISDQDKIFLSHFWIEMFMMQSTVLKRSTHFTHRQMGKPRGSIGALRCMFDVFVMNNQGNGVDGFLGPNLGITPLSTYL